MNDFLTQFLAQLEIPTKVADYGPMIERKGPTDYFRQATQGDLEDLWTSSFGRSDGFNSEELSQRVKPSELQALLGSATKARQRKADTPTVARHYNVGPTGDYKTISAITRAISGPTAEARMRRDKEEKTAFNEEIANYLDAAAQRKRALRGQDLANENAALQNQALAAQVAKALSQSRSATMKQHRAQPNMRAAEFNRGLQEDAKRNAAEIEMKRSRDLSDLGMLERQFELKRRLIESILGSGSRSTTETVNSEEVINDAGQYRKIPTTTRKTTPISPQDIIAMFGGI